MRKSETYRNEIKSYVVRAGMTMTKVVDYRSDECGEAVGLADALGYDIVWQKRER